MIKVHNYAKITKAALVKFLIYNPFVRGGWLYNIQFWFLENWLKNGDLMLTLQKLWAKAQGKNDKMFLHGFYVVFIVVLITFEFFRRHVLAIA